MDKNKKKFFLKYIANLFLIAMCAFLLNTNVIFAEGSEGTGENTTEEPTKLNLTSEEKYTNTRYVKKCTDLYRKQEGKVDKDLTLDNDLDYIGKCQSNNDSEPSLRATGEANRFINVSYSSLDTLQKDEDGNIPLYCKDVLPDKNDVGGQGNLTAFNTIRDYINNIKLCGDGWNNFVYESNLIKNYKNTKHWYPIYGAYSNSYEYILNKVLSGEYTCEDTYDASCLSGSKLNTSDCDDFRQKCFPSLLLGDEYCEKQNADSTECDNIKKNTQNIKNKFYREHSYGGMEFAIPIVANEIDKNYDSIESVYNKGDGCFDPRISSNKGYYGTQQRYYFKGKLKANYACDRFIYKGDKTCVDKNGNTISDPQKCKKLFHLAKQCCERRRNGGVCIYYTKPADLNYKNSRRERFSRNDLEKTKSIAFCSNYNKTNSNKCTIYAGNNRIDLASYYGKLDDNSSYKKDKNGEIINNEDKICVKTTNLAPYNFNLLRGAEIKDLYCDGDYDNCKSPNEYKPDTLNATYNWNENYGDDKNKIWNNNSQYRKETPAYGMTKNFCTYNVHCTENSTEPVNYAGLSANSFINNRFSPPVCFDFSKTSSQYTTEKNKSFTTPIAECMYETINNMFLNKAGMSSCKDPDESVNSEGLCGTDTFNIPENIRHEKYNAEYKGAYNAYHYIIGEELPNKYNIFRKIQAGVQNIIKTAMVIAIAIISFKFLIKGELDIFDVKHGKALVVGMLKFVIVIYFSIGNAWQAYFYKWLDTAMKYSYQKAFSLAMLDTEGKTQHIDVYCNVKKDITDLIYNFTCDKVTETTTEYLLANNTMRRETTSESEQVNITSEDLGTVSPKENEKLLIKNTSGQNGTKIKIYYTRCINTGRNQSKEQATIIRGREKENQKVEDRYARIIILNEKYQPNVLRKSLSTTNIIQNYIGQYKVEYAYYTNCRTVPASKYDYGRTYDGCYFGDAKYPEGKEYLSMFDSLDCKLSNYLHTSAQLTGIHIVLILVVLFVSAPVGILLLLLGFTLFFLLFAIVFKIFYFFIVNILAINILVFVSPIIFPALLFDKYKGIFDEWLKSIMGFCLQLVVILIFAGLFIGTIDRVGLGGAEYINHNPETGRNPELHCPTDASTSVLCLFAPTMLSHSKTDNLSQTIGKEILGILGLGNMYYLIGNIGNNGFANFFLSILSFVIVLAVFYNLLDKIPDIAEKIADSPSTLSSKVGVFNSALTAYKGMNTASDIIYGGRMMSNALVKKTGRDLAGLGRGIASVAGGIKDDFTRVDDGQGGTKRKFGENWRRRYNNWKFFEGSRAFFENQRDKEQGLKNEHKYAKLWGRRTRFRHDIKNDDK